MCAACATVPAVKCGNTSYFRCMTMIEMNIVSQVHDCGGDIMRIAISTIALLACTSLASAADLGGPYEYGGSIKDGPAIAAQPSWTGLYFGGHVGWATGGWDLNLSAPGSWPVYYDSEFIPATRSVDDDSWLGGLQIGFNRQHGSIVWGVEADVSWTDLNANGSFTDKPNGACAPNPCTKWDVNTSMDVFGTVRGRLGVLVSPQLLVYGTGGLAWGQADIKVAATHNPLGVTEPGPRVSGEYNHIGWTAGGGAEWMFAPDWTLKAEYMYVDLGKEKYVPTGTTTPTSTTPWNEVIPAELDFHTVRLGLNYKFGR